MAPSLSAEGRRRLRWIAYYLTHGRNVSRTCRHFDISREAFYRWWRRYDPRHLRTLEDERGTRRPRRVRQPTTPPALVERIRALREELPRMGFAIRALQSDGGSEWKAAFEQACEELGILLFVLPPRRPQWNGHVERAQRTHQEEFYELIEVPEDLGLHNALLREHEAVYNGLRPHQALGYLTPNEFLARCQADHR